MLNFFSNEKFVVKTYKFFLNSINLTEDRIKTLTDSEIKDEIQKLKKKLKDNQKFGKENLSDDIIINSFALTREAGYRSIGLRHFDSQILGGLVLNAGQIAEMKTGEGKTLVATLAASLNALTGKGTHIVTVNDYLAKRDATWMVPIYRQLGLSTGLIQSSTNTEDRKKNYLTDITYVTNSELGFDFLRDNSTADQSQIVQRQLNYCIIDEVDAILIDEARTPLILAGQIPTNSRLYSIAYEVSKFLEKEKDFQIDEKTSNINLTAVGITKIEKIFGFSNIFESNQPWVLYIITALRAQLFFIKNVHYIVRENQIMIVDEFTGRIMPDRRWSDGLHEAIEAKENLKVETSTKQTASITYQDLFSLYPKLSGMTGTAKTAENELEQIYNLEVFVLPTFRTFKRQDLPDKIYKSEIDKWTAVAKKCLNLYRIGRPVLIGTNSIEKSEVISLLLTDYGIPHKVLNAKPENLNFESEIIAQAGCKNSITVSTNMSGRGTDIILGGNFTFKTTYLLKTLILQENSKKLKLFTIRKLIEYFLIQENNRKNQNTFDLIEEIQEQVDFITTPQQKSLKTKRYLKILTFYLKKKYKKNFLAENDYVKKCGGLYVIGTERHDSRRIDNQLRGRAGRQGDPGTSIFYISLEDKLFRIFGGEKIQQFFDTLNLNMEGISLDSKALNRSLDNAQTKVENYYYDLRKRVYEYDKIITKQRILMYKCRYKILKTNAIRTLVIDLSEQFLYELAKEIYFQRFTKNEILRKEFFGRLQNLIGFSINSQTLDKFQNSSVIFIYSFLAQQFWLLYNLKELFSFLEISQDYERLCFLEVMDSLWSEHLDAMKDLVNSTGWSAYAQKDPLTQYKTESYKLFIEMGYKMQQIVVITLSSSTFILE